MDERKLRTLAQSLDKSTGGFKVARLVEIAKQFSIGIPAAIGPEKLRLLDAGVHLKPTKKLTEVVSTRLNNALTDDSPQTLRLALGALATIDSVKCFCVEAWRCFDEALGICASTEGLTLEYAVMQSRSALRIHGRMPENRILARPRLVKGLEFQNALVLNADALDRNELYVALTRGSKSLTLLSTSRIISPRTVQEGA